jgi:tetratricopeptide (TPR) repeat protein
MSGPHQSHSTLPMAAELESIEPGVLIGDRYRAVRWLGRGGMGSVYEVEDCALGVSVALKVADASRWDVAALGQLKREIQLARRVTHHNVCRVHDFGVHPTPDGATVPFLTMELVIGETLADAIRAAGRFSAQDALAIAEPIAAALDAAHAVGVIHRDFKSGNVMISGSRVIVMDFGLAIEAKADVAAGMFIGSPAYMAPEQVEGRMVTVATDVYAFGVVLFELVTGQLPFMREHPMATAMARLSEPPPSPATIAPELPERWGQTILRCMRVSPRERFETCGDVVRALRARTERNPIDRAAAARSVALVVARDVRDEAAFDAAIAEHGGTLLLVPGADRAGLFGGARSRGDEIVRAIAAAHAAIDVADHVGLAVGRATLKDGAIHGEALDEAALVLARRAGGALASSRTAQLLAGSCELVEVEPGLFSIGARRETSAALVGRDAELAALRRARDAALSESRLLATWIIGPLGVGKSRLCDAAIELALESGMRVTSARARAHQPRAYSLFASPSDAATEDRRAAQELALDDEASVAERRSAIGLGDDAGVIADRARSRIVERLVELASAGPLAIVLDDLQWADPASMALLEELVSLLPIGGAIWLVLAARDELLEARPELLSELESSGRIEPSALRARDVAALAVARTGSEPPLAVVQAIADRAGGNALFVEQLVEGLAHETVERGEIGRWPMPATIEHAVQARLDQLPDDERECVEMLSIFARPATASELEGLGARNTKTALVSLTRRGLVARAAAEGYRFKSPILGDVAYGLVSAEQKRELHRAAARSAQNDAEQIARHLEHAGDPGAAAAFARATLENTARGDSRGVLRCAERALALGVAADEVFAVSFARAEAARFVGDLGQLKPFIEHARQHASDDRERALVASEEGEWFRRNRLPKEALAHHERAVELATASGDEETRARATVRCAAALVSLARGDEAARLLDAIEPSALTPATSAAIDDVRGWLAGSVGDYGAARAAYARAAELYARAGDTRRAAGAESNHADADNRLGRFEDAAHALQRALVLTRRVGNRVTEGYALMNLGYALAESGRADAALAALSSALEIAQAIGDAHLALGARLYRARAMLTRATDDSLALELEALANEAAGEPTLEANARALAARAWLARAFPDKAAEHARRALELRDAHGAIEEGEGDVFWTAVLAFHAVGHAELATETRARGRARVGELAARIADPQARASFLERVAAHRFLTQ